MRQRPYRTRSDDSYTTPGPASRIFRLEQNLGKTFRRYLLEDTFHPSNPLSRINLEAPSVTRQQDVNHPAEIFLTTRRLHSHIFLAMSFIRLEQILLLVWNPLRAISRER